MPAQLRRGPHRPLRRQEGDLPRRAAGHRIRPHNATEGFGIVAPIAVENARPSWGTLALLGLIGGGPTFAGTLVGQRMVNDTLSIAFLGLAAGSILYVIIELLAVARRAAMKALTAWTPLLGVLLGFATDAVVTAAGV